MISRICILVLFVFGLGGSTMAQNDCQDALSRANKAYENGKMELCIRTLNDCFQSFDSKLERMEAYRLLALSHQSTYNSEKMHESIAKLLKVKPDYQIVSLGRDPIEFTRVLNTYTVKPKWVLGFGLAYVSNWVKVLENHQGFTSAESSYFVSPSYNVGLNVQRTFEKGLVAKLSLNALSARVNQELKLEEQLTQEYREQLNFVGVDIGLGYHYKVNERLGLHIYLQSGFNRLYRDKINIDLSDDLNLISQLSFDQLDRRRTWHPTLGGSVNLGYDLFQGKIGLGVSYAQFLKPTMHEDQLYQNPNFNIATLYNNDLLKLRQLSVGLTYEYPLRYMVKLKEK
jgi:hypothetical protein